VRGSIYQQAQADCNATQLGGIIRKVTIIARSHPLYGRRVAVVCEGSPGGKEFLTVELANGQRRSIASTDTEFASEGKNEKEESGLLRVSVRTMLPVAKFIREQLRTTEEHADDSLPPGNTDEPGTTIPADEASTENVNGDVVRALQRSTTNHDADHRQDDATLVGGASRRGEA